MHWNYRVVEQKFADGTSVFEICEVYYDEHGKPGYTHDKNVLSGDGLEDLQTIMSRIKGALEKPVLLHIGDKLIE